MIKKLVLITLVSFCGSLYANESIEDQKLNNSIVSEPQMSNKKSNICTPNQASVPAKLTPEQLEILSKSYILIDKSNLKNIPKEQRIYYLKFRKFVNKYRAIYARIFR